MTEQIDTYISEESKGSDYVPRHRINEEEIHGRGYYLFNTILGIVGELAITLGIILGLFVVWQLWWTNVIADEKKETILTNITREYIPAHLNKVGKVHPGTEAPPTESFNKNTGSPMGIIRVPRWGDAYKAPILQGVSRHIVLDKGAAGHYPESANPGEIGNFAIAGHREGYAKVFFDIDRLKKDDTLIVETPKTWIVYKVTKFFITVPTDVKVVAPVPEKPGEKPTERLITLTTCHPAYGDWERYIVHGKLDHWTNRADGVPPELANVKDLK